MPTCIRSTIMALCLIIALISKGQQINQSEYFFDTDPGVGKGTAFSLISGDSINVNNGFPLGNLNNGFHQLFIRFKDEQGMWSLPESRAFYIDPDNTDTIQNGLTQAEYFFDKDPGVGSVTPISIIAGDSVSINSNISIQALTGGFHQLFIRFRNADGKWGHAEMRAFYIDNGLTQTSKPLKALEYFIDKDPGTGKATLLNLNSITDSVNSLLSIPLSNLSSGFHQLHIRYLDLDSKWGLTETRSFYVDSSNGTIKAPIVAAEYFIGNDPGIGNGTAIDITKADSINMDFIANIADSLPLGIYSLSVRVKDSSGLWSNVESREIRVCSTYGAEAKFELVKDNNQVSLLNRSENAISYKWILNETDTFLTKNIYQKLEIGNYKTALIAINNCTQDTAEKSFTIEGFKNISPSKGGNIGRVFIQIEGFGFIDGTTFTLSKGSEQLVFDTVKVVNEELIMAGLNLIDAEQGFYKLKINIPGIPALEKDSAFEVVSGIPPITTIDIEAPPIIRNGRPTIVKVKITNQGNIDAYGVPVIIDGIPLSSTVKIFNDTVHLEGLPEDPTGEYANFLFKDTVSNQILIPVLLPQIAPGETKEIVLEITASSSFKVNANTYPPILTYNPDSSPGFTERVSANDLSASACKGCQGDVMQDIAYNFVKGSADLLIQAFFRSTSIGKWRECISSGLDLAYGIYNLASKKYLYTNPTVNKISAVFSMSDILGGAFKTGADCAIAAGGSTPLGFAGSLVYNFYNTYDKINKLVITPIYNPTICAAECLKAKTAKSVDVDVRTSYDPNIKTGPGTINGGYINKDVELAYKISFENDPTATLPALLSGW